MLTNFVLGWFRLNFSRIFGICPIFVLVTPPKVMTDLDQKEAERQQLLSPLKKIGNFSLPDASTLNTTDDAIPGLLFSSQHY